MQMAAQGFCHSSLFGQCKREQCPFSHVLLPVHLKSAHNADAIIKAVMERQGNHCKLFFNGGRCNSGELCGKAHVLMKSMLQRVNAVTNEVEEAIPATRRPEDKEKERERERAHLGDLVEAINNQIDDDDDVVPAPKKIALKDEPIGPPLVAPVSPAALAPALAATTWTQMRSLELERVRLISPIPPSG